jgi:hypothetical protein
MIVKRRGTREVKAAVLGGSGTQKNSTPGKNSTTEPNNNSTAKAKKNSTTRPTLKIEGGAPPRFFVGGDLIRSLFNRHFTG